MVVCITHSGDYYTIDMVQQELEKKGVPFFRFNSDEFALQYRIHYSPQQYTLTVGDRSIHAHQVTAVWNRKLWELKVPATLDPAYQAIYLREYNTFRELFFHALEHVPWMNTMQADRAVASDKLRQLQVAAAAGFTIPASIFTNDANTIRAFFKQCKGEVVMKLHNALSKTMKGDGAFFPTTRLSETDLEHIELLTYCPMIFQEYIPKAYELRVAWVAGECFAGKIPTEATPTSADWRTRTDSISSWQPYELPVAEQQKIGRLMQQLGLHFGAIDIIRHTNGQYVFLEVNPQGEWGMLQKYLHYPIAATIAAKLITHHQHAQAKDTHHHP